MFVKFKFLLLNLFLLFIFSPYSYSKNTNVKQALEVSFSTNPLAVDGVITICAGQSITYTNTSTNVGNNPDFLWSFTGGTPNSATDPGNGAL